jgi:hypothetical protein
MFEPLARLGYASKAFVYCLVGVLAGMAAFHRGGRVTDTRGVLTVILAQPLGNTVLFVLAAGLCGYAGWRVLDAIMDPERHGTRAAGILVRAGNIVRALVYGGLGLEALRLARGLRGSRGSDAQIRAWTAQAMNWPFGAALVVMAGAVVAVYGASEIVAAIRHHDKADLDLSPLGAGARDPLLVISRFGVAARACIIVALGIFLVRAAIRHDPAQAHGLRESVIEMTRGASGRWVLAAISAGLVAYAIDQALHARFRRIREPLA